MISSEIRGEISLFLDITVMTTVECPLLRGVVRTCPSTTMIGAHMVMSGTLGLTRDPFSFRTGSTEANITEVAMAEIIRVGVVQPFPVQSVLAEPFDLLRFPPTSGWRLGSANSPASRSRKLGWMITEWLFRSAEATTTWL